MDNVIFFVRRPKGPRMDNPCQTAKQGKGPVTVWVLNHDDVFPLVHIDGIMEQNGLIL